MREISYTNTDQLMFSKIISVWGCKPFKNKMKKAKSGEGSLKINYLPSAFIHPPHSWIGGRWSFVNTFSSRKAIKQHLCFSCNGRGQAALSPFHRAANKRSQWYTVQHSQSPLPRLLVTIHLQSLGKCLSSLPWPWGKRLAGVPSP